MYKRLFGPVIKEMSFLTILQTKVAAWHIHPSAELMLFCLTLRSLSLCAQFSIHAGGPAQPFMSLCVTPMGHRTATCVNLKPAAVGIRRSN